MTLLALLALARRRRRRRALPVGDALALADRRTPGRRSRLRLCGRRTRAVARGRLMPAAARRLRSPGVSATGRWPDRRRPRGQAAQAAHGRRDVLSFRSDGFRLSSTGRGDAVPGLGVLLGGNVLLRAAMAGFFAVWAGSSCAPFIRRRAKAARSRSSARPRTSSISSSVSLEAGIGFSAALKNSADRLGGPLGEEMRLALLEQRMGGRSRNRSSSCASASTR